MLRSWAALVLSGVLGHPAGSAASTNKYADEETWLCRPGNAEACSVDLSTTIVSADGRRTAEAWSSYPSAPIDCFYVYPTVSTDQTPNSDMTLDDAERNVVRTEFARFGSRCRLYAPLYRQVTRVGLGLPLDQGVGYEDVLEAWQYYLDHDNMGRGFVLIGHSQGASILRRLLREEIDGKPVQSRLVSALLAGPPTPIVVPRGQSVGGTFTKIPLCRSATDIGCVITYASFRSTAAPPPGTLFGGHTADPAMAVACTNPAALGGGSGELQAYLSASEDPAGRRPPRPWVVTGGPIATPWVAVPRLLTARCSANESAVFLEVSVHEASSDPRRVDPVDGTNPGFPIDGVWGLHMMDVSLAMGNLLDIVGQQAKAYVAGAR